jgi:alpha/beta superfamily hydrolase
MAEEPVFLVADRFKIAGLLSTAPGDKGVVITHPHPLYGGSMHNPVVETVARVYQRAGYSTLRFNFRGVGQSQGSYDAGRGEQEDVKAALNYLASQGRTVLDLAGYSFGAWVNALLGAAEDRICSMIMVSPPVAFFDFQDVRRLPALQCVITGDRDQFAAPDLIAAVLSHWNPEASLQIIKGADHFFGGYTEKLASVLVASLSEA